MNQIIMVEPERLEVSAQQINSLCDVYLAHVNSLYSEVEYLSGSWKGADNIAFVNQINGFNDDFNQIVTLLRQYGEFLTNSARAYRQTQSELASIARTLKN